MTEPLHPCTGCGSNKPADHVYKALKCCPDCDHRADDLTAAWAAAEAALPEGWRLWVLDWDSVNATGGWRVVAGLDGDGDPTDPFVAFGHGPTPTAALRALVAALADLAEASGS